MKKQKHKIITAGVLFSIATGIIYVINRVIFSIAVLKNLLKSSADNYYNWRFGKVYYKKVGTGSPVLLIHDLTVYSSSYEWEKIVNKLAANHTVYAVDLLGCGRSDKQKLTYTNYLFVQMISDFIKHVIREKTDIVTSGFSASYTLLACHNESELFGRIVMINPPALDLLNTSPNSKSKFLKVMLEIPIFGTLVYNMITCQSNIQLLFTEQYLFNPFNTNAEWLDTYYEAAHKGMGNGKYLLSSIIGKYTNNTILHALKQINNSLFIIEGAAEKDSDKVLRQYSAANAAIESVTLKGCKHLPQLETPDTLIEQINLFLDS